MLWTNTEITKRYYIFRSFVFLRLFPSLQLASYCFSKIVEWSLSLANFRNEMKFKKIVKGELFREGNSPICPRLSSLAKKPFEDMIKNQKERGDIIRRICWDLLEGWEKHGGWWMIVWKEKKLWETSCLVSEKERKKKKKEIDELRRKFLETMFLQWIDWIGVIW